jgi:uncharacterized membrane protein
VWFTVRVVTCLVKNSWKDYIHSGSLWLIGPRLAALEVIRVPVGPFRVDERRHYIDDAPKCIFGGSRLLVIDRRNCLHTCRVLANHAGEAIQVIFNRAIVSILFAAAFSKEVARYSSDRSHLFPFNPLSRTGRHSIRDCDRSAGSHFRGRYAAAPSVAIGVKEFASAAAHLTIKPAQMKTSRLEAFSDGVLAIIITIMVLELKVPHAVDLAALKPVLPVLLSYVLSFIYLGIYWNNHHHLFQATEQVSGGILWANLHLLFWLSLFPFTTAWIGENQLAAIPTAVYGFVLLMAAIAFIVLERTIIAKEGRDSLLASAIGGDWKRKLSPVLYFVAIPLAFVSPWIAGGIYVFVALLWLIPDPRIERKLEKREK